MAKNNVHKWGRGGGGDLHLLRYGREKLWLNALSCSFVFACDSHNQLFYNSKNGIN